MDLPPIVLSAHNSTNYTYSIEPDPFYSHQSWVSKFENIRRYEHDEMERKMRREREGSSDGMIEAMIVVGVVAMIVVPCLIWLYYKSGICDPARERLKAQEDEKNPRRRYSKGVPIYRPDEHPIAPFINPTPIVPPLKHGSGPKCPKSACVCTMENEKMSKKGKYLSLMKENAPYAPAKI